MTVKLIGNTVADSKVFETLPAVIADGNPDEASGGCPRCRIRHPDLPTESCFPIRRPMTKMSLSFRSGVLSASFTRGRGRLFRPNRKVCFGL
jgi:hypothetical protein